jgi:hypothetical protein
VPVKKANQLRAEADREGLDGDAIPARDQVVAHLMHEDDDRQNREERNHVGQEPEDEIHKRSLRGADAMKTPDRLKTSSLSAALPCGA